MLHQRYSRQREAILQNLQRRKDHPSADMVYESLRNHWPNLSLGTVYRNLNILSADGTIGRFTVQGKEHFDGNMTPHIHFVCTECGDIMDVFNETIEPFVNGIAKHLSCTVSNAHIVIYGKCCVCQK